MASIDDKYVKIQGWMVGQLGLTGNELMIYARIYSFQFQELNANKITKEAKPVEIPAKDFMDWTLVDRSNVVRTIQKLQSKGLVKVITNVGHTNAYSLDINAIKKAVKGVCENTHPCENAHVAPAHRGCSENAQGDVAPAHRGCAFVQQTCCENAHHRQQTTIDNNKTTKTTLRPHACVEADASSLSTDTETEPEKDYGDYSKAEIAFFEKQALNRLSETDPETDQKKYLTSNPQDQYPKAFLFMTAKNSSQFTDMEFELYKMALMYTAYGKIRKNAETVSQEEAEYVPPASEIGQKAHDAQQKFVDWVFHDGASPIQMARRK